MTDRTRTYGAVALMLGIAVIGFSMVAVANDVPALGPSVAVNDTTSGTNTTTVTPGGTTYIDVALNTTQTSDKKFTSPLINATLPSGWNLDPISSSSGSAFQDNGNAGEWLWINNRSRSNVTYEVNVPGGTASGTYPVSTLGAAINATTDNRVTDTDSTTITVTQRPTASFTISPNPADTGATVNFDASGSNDPDGPISSYNWSFGDGTTANNTGSTTTNVYADNGTFSVTLTVTGDAGLKDSVTNTVTINNRPPVANIDTNKTMPVTVQVGDVIQFDNGTSSDPDGSVVSNAWEFGDGTTDTGTPVTKAYGSPGTYQVNLTVTDDDGATNTTNMSVTVAQAPKPDFTISPDPADTGQSVTFDASSTTDDGTITAYNWSFGDGVTANNTGTTTSHTYSDNGTFAVTLTVTDNDGLTNTTTKTATINNRPPVANIGTNKTMPVTVQVGEGITFDNGTSSDPDGSIVSNSWEFGDATTATGASAVHSYGSAGTYQVNLTVTDDDGATNATNITVTVNAPPSASFTVSQSSAAPTWNESLSLAAGGSNDPDGSIAAYNWSFGDGNVSNNTGTGTSHTYDGSSTYSATLTVTDGDGLTDTATQNINVRDCRPRAIANYNTAGQQVDTVEIQFAVSWFVTSSVVQGSGEVMGTSTPPFPISTDSQEIQAYVAGWQTGTPASC